MISESILESEKVLFREMEEKIPKILSGLQQSKIDSMMRLMKIVYECGINRGEANILEEQGEKL